MIGSVSRRYLAAVGIGGLCGLQACSDRVIGKPVVDETSNGFQARILLPDGSAASGARVDLAPGWYVQGSSDSANRTMTADAQGEIRIEHLAEGSWWLEASKGEGSARILVQWQPRTPRLRDLELAPSGTLEGHAHPGATIKVYGSTRTAKADSSGRFVLDNLPAGPIRLRAEVKASTTDSLVGEASAQVVPSLKVTAQIRDSISRERALWKSGGLAILPPDPLGGTDSLADLLVPLVLGPNSFPGGMSERMDLLVTDHTGRALETHAESWNASERSAVVWVRSSWLHPLRGDTLRLLWGKPGFLAATSAPAMDSVHGIWHLAGTDPLADASNRHRDIAKDSGTSAVAGVFGEGRGFGGTQWLRIPAPTVESIAKSFTVSGWVRVDGPQLNHAKILDLGPSFAPYGSFLVDIDTATGQVGMQVALMDSSWQRIESTGRLAGWTHLAITWDGARREVAFYLDGRAQGTRRMEQGLLTHPGHDLLLGNQLDGRDGFRGSLDEFRWDASARSADWIRHLHFLQSPGRIRLEDDSDLPP